MKELNASLNDAHKGWKKVKIDLREMYSKNIDMSEEYTKSVEHDYSVLHAYFENAPKHVAFSIQGMNIKRTNTFWSRNSRWVTSEPWWQAGLVVYIFLDGQCFAWTLFINKCLCGVIISTLWWNIISFIWLPLCLLVKVTVMKLELLSLGSTRTPRSGLEIYWMSLRNAPHPRVWSYSIPPSLDLVRSRRNGGSPHILWKG